MAMEITEQSYDWAYDPGERSATRYIVLHHAAGDGDPQAIHRYHRDRNGWAGIAYHYYVRKDGRVYRGRPEAWNGGHTAGYNRVSLGVCFEGNFETERMGNAQLRAGRELVKYLREQYPEAAVVRHRDLGGTACPGANFPFAQLLEEETETTDKPSTWAKADCEWAVSQGLFKGDTSGNFRWGDNVTRQELAVILHRFEGLE